MRKLDRHFFNASVGMDGLLTLILSNITLLVTGGVLFLALLIKIIKQAKNAPLITELEGKQREPSNIKSKGGLALVAGYLLGRQDQLKFKFKQRLDAALDYLEGQEAVQDEVSNAVSNVVSNNRKVCILGGKTGSGNISEARAGRAYLLQHGVAQEKISIEEDSQHTLENLFNIRKQLGEEYHNTRLHLITSRYHLARSLAMAKGLGMSVQPLAAEKKLVLTAEMLVTLIKEAYLLHWYYVGKWWTQLTKNKKSLNRIS